MTSQKERARRMVRDAIKRGALLRPARCEECGERSRPASDGRATIHAHHFDGYDKPLSVRWLCPTCHFQRDPRPAREANGRSVLTETAVDEIRSCGHTKRLAEKFGVDRATIQRARRGENWIDAALITPPAR